MDQDAPASNPPSAQAQNEALRSVHTGNLPALFEQLQISLVVSTYQAGKVILVRKDGDGLNTHFRSFAKPMGIATEQARLTIGGANMVWYYRNIPAVGPKLEPLGKHDACFVPRRIHVTGDIDIHEMAYDRDDALWIVNTRFACLCTLDEEHSFTPRWRPPFVSALAAEDRCHLNGLAMMDGKPKYVTALGETDNEGGWRKNKANGGLLMDIDSNEILLRGLSMPHSPRVYKDRLWVLESGQGSLAKVDLKTGTWQTLAEVPGFTRGIDFYGPLAFIGLSQVRESAVFSGIPLVKRLRERTCGIWVVNIESGETVGFLRFEAGVQEIFSVQILHGMRFPEILEWNDPRISHSYVLPDAALAEVVLPSDQQRARSPAFHCQTGTALFHQGRLPEAIAAYRACVNIDPTFPNARYNLGVALGEDQQYEEATQYLLQAIEAEPERAEAYNSLGHVAHARAEPRQAVTWYEQAIELQPNYAHAHFNLGMTLLQLGEYHRGWIEYQWRWKTGQFPPFQCPHPQWDGQVVREQTLLVHTEQGAGDAIQFARYLPLAAARCKKLLLVCRADLTPLFSTLPDIGEVRQPGAIKVAEFDTWVPLLSLPLLFDTTLDTIPTDIPYFDSEVLQRRKEVVPILASPAGQRNIGIAWAGSATHRNDRNRSCPLGEFVPVLKAPNILWHSLQKGSEAGAAGSELATLPSDIGVQDQEPHLHDFGDLALYIAQLDLVISVDTAVIHLAGALGKPAWLLLPYVPDWRWGLTGETTPWYPTLRLFRQTRPGDWAGVMARVAAALPKE